MFATPHARFGWKALVAAGVVAMAASSVSAQQAMPFDDPMAIPVVAPQDTPVPGDVRGLVDATELAVQLPLMQRADQPGGSSELTRAEMVAKLRLQRGQRKAAVRAAIMEAHQWAGYEPLRPTFTNVPLGLSYVPVIHYQVPVFVR